MVEGTMTNDREFRSDTVHKEAITNYSMVMSRSWISMRIQVSKNVTVKKELRW